MPQELRANRTNRDARAGVDRLRLEIGIAIRSERRARGFSLRELAAACGLHPTTIYKVEIGEPASLDVLGGIAAALRLNLRFELATGRRAGVARQEDPVHAAMGEIEAVRFASPAHLAVGVRVNLDVPYQHYQHAGRGDFVAWTEAPPRLLHLENRTEFPNTQAALGSFNAKRAYLGADLAARFGVARWQHQTHVIVALWSAEVLHELRLRCATWRATCPDSGSFEAWWRGEPPSGTGVRSELIVWDPRTGSRSDRRRWVGLEEMAVVRPRYREYGEALAALRAAGIA